VCVCHGLCVCVCVESDTRSTRVYVYKGSIFHCQKTNAYHVIGDIYVHIYNMYIYTHIQREREREREKET